jgi:hypothetical protein
VLIDRANLPRHVPWIIFVLAAGGLASVWYFVVSVGSSAWPGGRSLPGFTFGVVAGLIIIFEVLLWLRKKVRAWRIGRAELWLRAHVWLGLLTLPLLLYHSGFRLGGELSCALMLLFLVVFASGVFGLVLQQFLPRRLLDSVPAETIYSQIERVSEQLREEAQRLILASCGPGGEAEQAEPPAPMLDEPAVPHLTVGAVRSVGQVRGKTVQTIVRGTPLAGAEPLRQFHGDTVEPFLRAGAASRSPLRFANRSAEMFRELRRNLDPAAHHIADALESLCDQRRQFDEQARIQLWLNAWLSIHAPLSFALVALMFVHAYVAMKYC